MSGLKKRPHTLEFYRTLNLRRLRYEWAWRTTASNGQITGRSSEKYYNKSECEQNAKDVSKSIFFAFKDSTIVYTN